MPDKILDGITSDPAAMGWMQGFPPPADKRIDAATGSGVTGPSPRETRTVGQNSRMLENDQRVWGNRM